MGVESFSQPERLFWQWLSGRDYPEPRYGRCKPWLCAAHSKIDPFFDARELRYFEIFRQGVAGQLAFHLRLGSERLEVDELVAEVVFVGDA